MARRDRVDTAAASADSPAIRLLDAMRAGDDEAVLAVCGETTTVSAENMGWSCRGRDEIHAKLEEIRERFPGLTFESRTRHTGFGLVIDEARVQDLQEDEESGEAAEAGGTESRAQGVTTDVPTTSHAADADAKIHPMWDEPVAERRTALVLWRETAPDSLTPTRLNMPVRVTVRHDDLQVHEVTLSFPAALLKRALGMHVDPFEMSLSEVQSAFIAPVGAGLSTTYELARPELTLVPPAVEPEQAESGDEEPPRKRHRRVVPVLLLLLAVIAAGAWWVVQGRGGNEVAGTPRTSPSLAPQTQPSASASPSTDSTKTPVVTHGRPSDAPSRKPNVTLTSSDLAFGKNSAALSSSAKSKIDDIAAQVKAAGLSGNIYVNGYTDNLGSAQSGITLSRQRAEAVSEYLGSQLVGVPVTIVVVANGEKDPIASNDTEAGRQKNRRVTITLPKP